MDFTVIEGIIIIIFKKQNSHRDKIHNKQLIQYAKC